MKPKNPLYLLQEAEIGIDGYECSFGRGVAIYTKTALQATAVTRLQTAVLNNNIGRNGSYLTWLATS